MKKKVPNETKLKVSSEDLIYSGKKLDMSKKVKVKTAKGRSLSSTNWLRRQLNDPFVKLAKEEGFRSRAAYKLIEINDKFNLIRPGDHVLDLGAAPGGWTQVAVTKSNSDMNKIGLPKGSVIGIDLNPILPLYGAKFYQLDFFDPQFSSKVQDIFKHPLDVVISDMAANSSGHKKSDHLRIMALCEASAYYAFDCLKSGGNFVAKVLAGGAEMELQVALKRNFATVKNFKPNSSRSSSSEKYVVALNFKKN